MKRMLLNICTIGGFVAIWHAVLAFGLVSPAALAYPEETFRTIPNVLSVSGNLQDVAATMRRSAIAFVIAVPMGIILGILVFSAESRADAADFLLDFFRSMPATAMVPVFLIILGIGEASKIGPGVFSAGLVIALATRTGLEKRNAIRLDIAKLFGFTARQRIMLLNLPEAVPHVFLGLRAGISLALILVVVSEMMIGSTDGLGRVIVDMQYSDDKARLYAAILVVGCIGYFYNRLLLFAEKRLIWWRTER